jgi:20S proteasome alpha/beta subunit
VVGRYQRLVFRHKLYQLREERDMKPETFASLVSALLYEKRLRLPIQV